jgi:hypothetical protein
VRASSRFDFKHTTLAISLKNNIHHGNCILNLLRPWKLLIFANKSLISNFLISYHIKVDGHVFIQKKKKKNNFMTMQVRELPCPTNHYERKKPYIYRATYNVNTQSNTPISLFFRPHTFDYNYIQKTHYKMKQPCHFRCNEESYHIFTCALRPTEMATRRWSDDGK